MRLTHLPIGLVVFACAVLALGGPRTVLPSSTLTAPADDSVDAATVRGELRQAISEAQGLEGGVRLDADAAGRLSELVDQAARRMAEERVTRPKLENAKGRVFTVVRVASKFAKEEGEQRVSRRTVERVMGWLCPGFWPFC